jgi:hypothetical protein
MGKPASLLSKALTSGIIEGMLGSSFQLVDIRFNAGIG